jgi:hypothetical protein
LPVSDTVLLLSNLPFYFRVRIGPEVLQLSPPLVLYFPGLMQARRLRLNRRRPFSTRCTADQEQTIRCCKTRIRLQGLSRPDSSLESLAAIPALDYRQCNFRDLKLQLLSPAKLCNFRGSRSAAGSHPVIHCSRSYFPACGTAAVINGLISYFPVWVPFRLRGKNVNSCLVDIRHIFESGVQG